MTNFKSLAFRTTQLALMLCGVFCLTRLSPANPPTGPWVTTLEKAKQIASKENKPILAMFSASWCGPCNMMKQEVFPREDVKKALSAWTLLYIDVDEQEGVTMRYGVEAFPTFVVMDQKGEKQASLTGAQPPKSFIRWLNALNKGPELKKRLAREPQNAKLWKQLGDMQMDMESHEEAFESYKKASKLDPKNETGAAADVAFLGALKTANEDRKQGAEKLAAIERQYPASERAEDSLFIRAIIALDQENEREARDLLTSYLKKYPDGKRQDQARMILERMDEKKQSAAEEQTTGTLASGDAPPPAKPSAPLGRPKE